MLLNVKKGRAKEAAAQARLKAPARGPDPMETPMGAK
jgi:hypothetical protein